MNNATRLLRKAMLTVICCIFVQAAQANADAAWSGYLNRFLGANFEAHPELAVWSGRHEFDGRLPDLSRAGIARDIVRLQSERRKAMAFDPAQLSDMHRFQRGHLLAYLDEQLFWLTSAQAPFHNPSFYQRSLSGSASVYVMRPYASATTRMRAYIAYAEAIPQAMENIRANLAGPLPRTYVDLGRTVFGGLAKFYEQYAPEAFASVQDEKLVARFKTANAGAIAAARALDTWLESRRSTAGDDFALGSERFSEMLRASEQLDVSIDRLEQLGRDDLDRNRAALGEACATFAPGKTVNDCVAVIQARKPNPGPVEVASDQLPELRRFVENQQLVTIPGGEEAQLIEAPPQLRWNPAGIILSGGLERRDVPSFYYVTPADASWNEAERKAYIVDVESLRIISVHEVWPGHFLHSQHAYRAPSVLARIFWNNCTSEGWAHYTEEMMVDAGLGSTDGGETRIAQLLQALVRNVRFLSAIGLHTGRMSLADSEQMFREKAFYDSAGARQQAARGTFDPAYLDYTLGKLMIRKLREDWTSTRGGRDAWHAFHDEFLSYGAPPIPLVRAAMLGPDAGPPL